MPEPPAGVPWLRNTAPDLPRVAKELPDAAQELPDINPWLRHDAN